MLKNNLFKDILVSVIMSTKETPEDILRNSIESILNQSYKNFEFIIISDGCENDFNIIKTYKDNRIKIIEHKESKGLPMSLNEAIEVSNGKYIARMDSDDIALPNRLLLQVNYMEKNLDVGICGTLTKSFGDKNNYNINLFFNEEGIKSELFLYNCLVHPTIMFRGEFLKKNNIRYNINFKYSQDYELWSRCCKLTKIGVIPKVCLLYRVHNKQISISKIDEQNELCKKILKKNMTDLDIIADLEIIDIMFYLSHKSQNKLDDKKVLEFIKKVLNANRKKKIYKFKYISIVLYYNYCITKIKQFKELPNIIYMFKGRIFTSQVKKIFTKLKFKLFDSKYYRFYLK